MKDDPIVEETRHIREAYAAQFSYDLQAIYQDLKRLERQNPNPHRRRQPKRIVQRNHTKWRSLFGFKEVNMSDHRKSLQRKFNPESRF